MIGVTFLEKFRNKLCEYLECRSTYSVSTKDDNYLAMDIYAYRGFICVGSLFFKTASASGGSYPPIQRSMEPLTGDLPITVPSPGTFEFWKF